MDVDARIEALTLENEGLRARIGELEDLLGFEVSSPPEWSLTGAERRVFGVLYARPMATKDAIMAALYRDRGRDEAEIKIVDVFVCKIRAKLAPFGIKIETRWGQGYYLTPEMKRAARAQLEQSARAA